MSHDETLEALRQELAKQDDAFEAAKAALAAVDADLELAIPEALLEEMDAVAKHALPPSLSTYNAVRA